MVRVRTAAEADLPRLVEIAAHSATAAHWNPAEYQKLFAPETLQNRLVLVVEEDAQVLGLLVNLPADHEAKHLSGVFNHQYQAILQRFWCKKFLVLGWVPVRGRGRVRRDFHKARQVGFSGSPHANHQRGPLKKISASER